MAAATMAYPPRIAPAARTDPAATAGARGKTEPSRRSLCFLSNSKPSRALNHRQSELQEAPVRQPYPPTMKISRGINLVRPQLLYFGSNNRELLEVDFFLPPYIYLGRWQITSFGKKKILGTSPLIILKYLLGHLSKPVIGKGLLGDC